MAIQSQLFKQQMSTPPYIY